MTPPPVPQSDILSSLNQKALLSLATDQETPAIPHSYRLPSTEELSELFPDLEIVELLGTGGMGCVFKARQKKLDRVVALKILPRELARDDMFAERFSREARAMARLNHPNIVSIYDFGQAGDVYYLAMEYMDGMNLRELIDAQALNPHEGYAVFAQVCHALSYAHSEGVVHRDIKPENILFNKQGHVALADFGLARLAMDTNAEFSITQTRQAMGTLNYMAPEQYEDPKSVDHRADIYALGVLLYELITGKIPRGSFPPASTLAPTGPNVDHIINRALQVTPDDRYASVEAMLGQHSETVISPQAAVGENGTFTNFVNIGAAPFRMIGKLAKPVEIGDEQVPRAKRKWIPLHTLTYIATAITFLMLCFPWETSYRSRYWGVHQDRESQRRAEEMSRRYSSFPGFIQTDSYDDVPFILVLPILGILSLLARFRTRMHPFRWFVMVVACFIGLFSIPALIRSPSLAPVIYIGTMVLLAFEYLCFCVARLLCAEAKLLKGAGKP